MKKLTAVIISVLLIIAMLPMGAFAAENKASKVEKQIEGARDYVFGSVSEFTFDKSADFYLYLCAGGDYSKYEKAYNESVAAAYNEGKITDAATYACIILCTQEDAENYALGGGKTVNLVKEMEKCSPSISSPYYYRYIFEVAQIYDVDEAFTDKCLTQLLSLYTIGKGMDNWGYGCDNTANFLMALAEVDGLTEMDYSAQCEDALKLLEGYKVEKGYFYNADYGTEPNTNSTATALSAYSVMCDDEKAENVYDMLLNFQTADKVGVFGASRSDMAANAYATKDALLALINYDFYVLDTAEDDEPEVTEPTTKEPVKTTTPLKQNTPSTGDDAYYIALCSAGVAVIGVAVMVALKKKEVK